VSPQGVLMLAAIVLISVGAMWWAHRIDQAAERATREYFRQQLAEMAQDDDWPDEDESWRGRRRQAVPTAADLFVEQADTWRPTKPAVADTTTGENQH
jgi:hypothetical protein